VIQLERKLITAESALEATGNMATALEGDKKAIAVELDQRITETKSLKAQLDEKEAKLLSTQTELHNLQSKWSHLDNSGSKTDDREQTISVLESENYNLVRKLEAQSISLERFQTEQEKHSRLELEYNELKKRHDELHTNDAELRRQLMDAQDAASNSERLQKNVADSESFISSLQSDLAQTRASHHQQLLEIRNRHVTEIDHLSDELQKEKHAKREAENVNSKLLDKILNLETTVDRLEQKMTSQSKCHADQTDKLMQELNETREKLSVSREEASIAKQECIDKTRAIDRLQSDIEHQKNQFSSTISRLEKDLDAKAKQVQQLQIVVEERDRDIINLKSDVSLRDHRTANDIDRLNEVIHQLQQDLKSSAAEKEFLRTSKDALQTRIQTTKLQVEESIASLRREKATLASDVQTHLVDAKTEIIQYVNGVVMGQWRRMENYQLHQSMNHEVALASAREELNKMDHLLQEGRNKAQQLQKSLRLLRDENDEALRSIKTISSKLSVPEKDVVEKIEDLLIELSDARSEIATIGIDLTTTMSELAKLNHEKDQLTLDRDHMKNVLDLTTAQMKEFETDANVQREKASSAITCLEQKLANDRCSFENKMAANEQIVAGLRAENERLQCSFDEAKKECATMRDELSVTKKDVVSLNEQLREKTETIHNLNDLLSRASQKAADDLVNHYMKIEDDLRAQLYTVQCEKEAIERQMKTQVEESGRTLEEFQVSKEELLACVDRLSSDLNIAQQQVQTMESELRYLSEEKGELFVEYTKAIRERDLISVKNSSSSKQIQNLTFAIEKLNNVHVSSEREHTAEVSRLADELIQTHSVEIDELNNKLLEANLIINELKSTLNDVKTEHTCDLNMSIEFYKSELDSQKANHLKYIEGKKEEMARLRNEVDELTSSKSLLEGKLSEREDLIDQLKASLRDALQNALQSDASKRDSDDKLAEISDTLSSYDQIEECASSLSGSLSGILHLKSTIERLISDKQDLECTLTESQTALASLQSKLSVVNQVNEQLREEIKAQKDKVNQLNDENKERLVDQKWMEDRLESLQNERQKETEICHDLVARMQKELEIAKQNEEELMGQIMVLRQDCDIEYLYKELLDKMKEKELKYESEIQNLVVQNDTLKNSLATLSEEKKSLLRAYDESNANTSGLVQRLDDANAHSSKLVEKLASAENELKVLRRNVMSKDIQNDEMSTASSLASNMLNQTASDLDSTIKSIKKHHLSTVQKLRNELDEMRTRWKKSEQRVKELTKLLQDNSKVIDALHKKLTGKQRHIKGNKTTMISSSSSSAQQSFSAE
jgi:chromosome segregation ATPase